MTAQKVLFPCCIITNLIDSLVVGARMTYNFNEECTHVLVDQLMPLKEDLVDAIVAKKPVVLWSWIEVQNQCPLLHLNLL